MVVRRPILELRVHDETTVPSLMALCAGYEAGRWRQQEMARDLLRRHLISFAYSWSEAQAVNADSAADDLAAAATLVYTTEKYGRRGEFGELLLHAVIRDVFGGHPAISKIYFKTATNETVKGFDSVHVVEAGKELELWLGEVKFYKDVKKAIRDVLEEIVDHFDPGYLRREFLVIYNKIDPQWPHADRLKNLLDQNTSLDQIIDSITVPVLLTYESQAVSGHAQLDETYCAALEKEARAAWDYWCLKTNPPLLDIDLKIRLILVPLREKKELIDSLHERLVRWQDH